MPIHSYSPSHTEIPVLDRLTTGETRHRLLDTLTEAVRTEVGRESHQHQLLIGPRGSGKTHSLTLVAHRLRTDPELQSQVLPIILAEEEVASHPADLMHKVLEKLADGLDADIGLTGREATRRECGHALAALRSEEDDERALEIAVGALEAASAALGRLLVAILENLDSLLYAGPSLSRGSAIEDQWGLRRMLLETRGLLVLGAAPTLFGEVTDPEAPFYDFFRLHHLEELPPDEMLALIHSRLHLELENETLDPARRTRLQTLTEHFEERTPKLRGLLVLTGGLPRFAHLIFDLLAETDLSSVAGTLSRFLDEQTPYFQSRLDPRIIPKAELEVLDAIASAEGPLTPKEIAARLRARAPNAVATYLKRLRERRLVKPSGTLRKTVRYDLTEPLFRVWRRFRRSRTEQDQVVLLAEVVAAMFDRPELEDDWKGLEKTTSAGLRRSILETALKLQGWDLPNFDPFLMPERFRPVPDLSERIKGLIDLAEKEYWTGSLARAFELYKEALEGTRQEGPERSLPSILNRFFRAALSSGAFDIARQAAEEAKEIATRNKDDFERADAIRNCGRAFLCLGEKTEALEAFKTAEMIFQQIGSDLGRAYAIQSRGQVLFRLDKNTEAIDAFEAAESIFKQIGSNLGRAEALGNRGQVLLQLGEYLLALEIFKAAETFYQKIDFNRGRAATIRFRGKTLSRLGDHSQALEAVQLAESIYQEIGDNLRHADAILDRGEVLVQLGDFTQALEAFRLAESIYQEAGDDLGRANAISSCGQALYLRGDDSQALKAFHLAESLYQKVGDDLGMGNCSFGYGLLALAEENWEEGLDHFLTAYRLERKAGSRFNIDLVTSTIWSRLAELASRVDLDRFRRLLRLSEPILRETGNEELARQRVVQFARDLLTAQGPELLLDVLPILEAGLTGNSTSLLRPLRLAAEVKTGSRPEKLPEESEEMRRAVSQVLSLLPVSVPEK